MDNPVFYLCLSCVRFLDDNKCEAFPDGIPEAIIKNEVDHHYSYTGDNGLLFSPVNKKVKLHE